MAVTGAPGPVLLTAEEMTSLARLQLVYRRPHPGHVPGERRSPRTARSAEFSDFRPYVSGDDLRQIDWQAYARFERLILRLYVAEEESALNIVVDSSDSMALGSPSKWQAARRIAAIVTLVGLAEMDRVAVGVLRRGGPFTAHVRRGAGAGQLLGFLAALEPGGTGGPDDLAGLRWLRPGMTVIISDFLVEESWINALASLRHARHEPVLWQILAPDEEHPDISGDVELRDVETARQQAVTITPRLVREYLRALAEHREGLRRDAAAAHGRFLHTLSGDDFRQSLRAALQAGVLRRA